MFSAHLQSRARNRRRIMYVGFVLALCCALAAVGSGVGYRLGVWHFMTGFQILKWSFVLAVVTLLVLLVCIFFIQTKTRMDVTVALLGILICLAMIYIPYSWKRMLDAHPYIHDITTDIEDPPTFVIVGQIRTPDHHSIEYEGREVTEEQVKAYPDLETLVLEKNLEEVFGIAERVLTEMGLAIVSADINERRIEATATTFLFGFKDDMVIRFKSFNEDSIAIDVRSQSRVGKSDLGQNAKRIRQFMNALKLEHTKH